MYPLYNSGSISLDYSIDLSGLVDAPFPIFQCMTTTGRIMPGEIDSLEWVFRPLEARHYSVDVPITVDGVTRVITFKGQGFRGVVRSRAFILQIDARKNAKILHHPSPPIKIIKAPDNPAQLSIERLNFGHVPLKATLCQILVLRNTSETATLGFSWETPSFQSSVCSARIKPEHGSLLPGKSLVCKVELRVGLRPGFYDFDLVCKIVNETENDAYVARREAIEYERHENRPLSAGPPSKPSSAGRHDLRNTKYRPLPPIASSTGGNTARVSVEGGVEEIESSEHIGAKIAVTSRMWDF
jgi:hypothetical protein